MIGIRRAHRFGLVLALAAAPAALQAAEGPELPPGPLTADQVVRIAIERNYDVAIAEANYQASRGQSRQALRGVLPSLSASATYNHTKVTGPAIVDNRPAIGETEADSRNVNLTLDHSFFNWASIQNLRSARASSRSSGGLAKTEALDVALEVRSQFYDLLKAIKLREVRDEAVKLSEDQLHRAETMFELGSVARNDVLQARVNLQQGRLDQIKARNLVEVERGQLAQLMGLPADTPIEIADEIEAGEVGEVDSTVVVHEALQARPDVSAARETIDASSAGLGAARAGRYPELFGRVNWFWTYRPGTDQTDGLTLENDTNGWAAAAGVSMSIFDGMLTEGQIKSAKSQLAADRSRLQRLESAVALEVKEAILGVREAQQSIAAATEGVGLAQENLSLAQQRYEVGSGTILELNEAQVSLIEARSALVDSQAALRVAQARLDRARGAGLP